MASRWASSRRASLAETSLQKVGNEFVDIHIGMLEALMRGLIAAPVAATALAKLAGRQKDAEACHALVWASVASAASDLGASNELSQRLVDLLVSSTQLSHPKHNLEKETLDGASGRISSGKAVIDSTDSHMTPWPKLPRCSWEIREKWADIRFRQGHLEDSDWQRWTNINVFCATLISRLGNSVDLLSEYRGLGACALARVVEYWEPSEDEGIRGPNAIPAAYAWIELAGENVAALIDTGNKFEVGPLWQERSSDASLTRARWEFWVEGFQKFGNDDVIPEKLRRMAEATAQSMLLLSIAT